MFFPAYFLLLWKCFKAKTFAILLVRNAHSRHREQLLPVLIVWGRVPIMMTLQRCRWGRPIVEAMAMGLPVIATNWSAMLEYMTEENSFPVPVTDFEECPDEPQLEWQAPLSPPSSPRPSLFFKKYFFSF